ncbi:MAG: radical SAM protein [Chitinophagales bacterium]
MEAFKLVQLANAYSQSLLAFKTDRAARPFSASFAVTNSCNISCSYCNCPNLKTPELNLDQINVLFAKLKKMGVVRLGLLGGEPLWRKDILEIISLAKKVGFFVSMNTNLLMYQKYKDKLGAIDYFFTSLDGTPEKHIANRGAQSYEKIINAIRQIVNNGQKVTAICVVTEPDIASADYLLELAEKEKITIHFQPECYDAENTLRSASENMQQQAIRNYWNYIITRKKQGARISSSMEYLKYISEWKDYSQTSFYDPEARCAAGRGFLFIDSSGYTFPCPYTKGSVEGINLLSEEWNEKFNPLTPCTKCIVGPMLEFNLLFDKPVASILSALGNM